MGRALWELVLRDMRVIARDRLLLAFAVLIIPAALYLSRASEAGPEAVGVGAAAVAVGCGVLVSGLRWRDAESGYLSSLLVFPIDRSTLALATAVSAGVISGTASAVVCGTVSGAWGLSVRHGIGACWYVAIGAGAVAMLIAAAAGRVRGDGFPWAAGLVGLAMLVPVTDSAHRYGGAVLRWLLWLDPAWATASVVRLGVSATGQESDIPSLAVLIGMWVCGAAACTRSLRSVRGAT